MSDAIRVSREGRVLRITLSRPEKRNALNAEMCRNIVDVVSAAYSDAGIGCLLMDAVGPVFCAGMDLDEAAGPEAAVQTEVHRDLFTMAARARKPIVAAVAGPALGGGCGLVANAHVVVAAQGASFGLTEIRIGMFPFAIFRSVASAIGERRALELALTGRIFGVTEAQQWGLVHFAVPPVEVEDRSNSIAGGLAASSAEAIRRGMEFVAAAREKSWDETLAMAVAMRSEQFSGPDFAEGVRAFSEKRPPRWPSIHGLEE